MTEQMVPLIVDCDTGIDDALALALATRSPSAELLLVSTVAGNIDIEHATRNTQDVLALMGAEAVMVHRGASHPLARKLEDASHVHGSNGLGGACLPEGRREIGADRGPAAIIRLAMQRPGEITLVCLGPLTNLAIALNVEPALAGWLKTVVVMGGAYRVAGNVTSHAEFNVFCDPEAADQVFAAPFADLVAVGLDVTHQTAVSREGWLAAETLETPAGRLVREVLAEAFSKPQRSGFYIHDALAVAVALDRSLVQTERQEVTVETTGERRGQTTLSGPGDTAVATGVDADRFLHLLGERLGLPALGHPDWGGAVL